MATATKSRLKSKKTEPTAPARADESEQHDHVEHDLDAKPGKIKKPIEIDEPEVGAVVEEKIVEEDPLIGAVEEDEAAEEASLDGEELNPFGDRWEE